MGSANKKVIIIALLMAIVTSFLIYVYIKKATTKNETVEYIDVYIAAKTLPPKNKILDADLKAMKVTREYLNPKAILNKSDIVGKRTKDSIIEGEQILRGRLVEENKQTLAFSVPEGKRAVSVNVNEQIEVGGLIRPGDYVDVIASFEKEELDERTTKTIYPRITKTILQNVQILAIGQDQLILDEKIKELPKTITLAVKPQEAERLVFASEYGLLRLALRPVNETETSELSGALRNELSTEKGIKTVHK